MGKPLALLKITSKGGPRSRGFLLIGTEIHPYINIWRVLIYTVLFIYFRVNHRKTAMLTPETIQRAGPVSVCLKGLYPLVG